MAKPIFIVKIPYESATRETVLRVQRNAEEKLTDYHCLVVPTGVAVTEFQCLNSSDCDEIKFEELKKIVIDLMK